MKLRTCLSAVLLSSVAALAQTPSTTPLNLCSDALSSDNQPAFTNVNVPDRTAVTITSPGDKLKLDTALVPFNPEKIILPVDQRLSISYVYESAGATHSIGYLYYDDLIAAGYINTNGTDDSDDDTLVDSNANGIVDFHEDLYNLAPPSGPQARPYVGAARRCPTSATFTSGGFTYTKPELATNACGNGNFRTNQSVRNAAIPANWSGGPNINVDLIGDTGSYGSNAFNDLGLFGWVPNLLEPAAPENGNRGLGRLIFLLSDDDTDTNVWNGFPPITDANNQENGIPDYDVSAYDSTGRLMTTNPDPGITTADRTVDLGVVQGGRELVFFMLSHYDPSHGGDRVYPCLRFATNGNCNLHLISPGMIFFSKARLNLDQNPSSASPAAIRNIGCNYNGGSGTGLVTGPVGSPYLGSTRNCWLDTGALSRLNTAAYNNLVMPLEASVVARPTNNKMPHVMVGAPSTDPYRWIFGFEDLSGGGDRDFNDVVVLINKINGGTARSGTVSGSIPIADADSMTITKVRIRRVDDISRGTWTSTVPGACVGPPLPSIRYYFAVDCKVKNSSGTWVTNDSPRWTEAVFPPGVNELTIDTLDLGLVGSQLCWRVDLTSPRDTCTPVVDDVDIGYQAIRTGDYNQSPPIPIANVAMFGVYETPGAPWNGSTTAKPVPSVRTWDNKQDFSLRGHLYNRRLYNPDSTTPNATSPALIWDAAEQLALSMPGRASTPLNRRIFTMASNGSRIELKDELALSTTPALPDTMLYTQSLGRYPYDLNRNTAGNAPGNASDRDFLRDWLYGWEDRQGVAAASCVTNGTCKQQGNPTPVPRAWPMGGVQIAAPAVIAAPATAGWFNFTTTTERAAYLANFSERLKDRDTVAFVGTLTGYLHAFNAGEYRRGNDPCMSDTTPRGYFQKQLTTAPFTPNCSGTRNYGGGEELFAYAPRALLSQYSRNYIGNLPGQSIAPAQINASPSFADVDLGNLLSSDPAWTIDSQGRPDRGAKTALVTASGPRSDLVFALDVTDPSKIAVTNTSQLRYPIPMWEWRMGSVLPLLLPNKQPDTKGSRHSPPIIRADFGSAGKKWIAAIATDYVPNSGTAGTVYLLDLATGRPVQTGLLSLSTIGIVTLENNEGIGGEPSAVDVDADGSYDVLYVPSTSGRVFRINFAQINLLRPIDQIIKTCMVADTAATLTTASTPVTSAEALKQGIYSPLAIKVMREGTTKVQFYYGTADNPDDPNDPQASRYYVMAYEDRDPLGTTCASAAPLWQQQLHDGQQVWGGVSLGKDQVYAVTAVGKASDACNLSPTEDGRLYTMPQVATVQLYTPPASAPQVRPSVSGGAVYDEHFVFVTVDGKLQARGDGTWNNAAASGTGARRRMLMWQPLPPGRLP